MRLARSLAVIALALSSLPLSGCGGGGGGGGGGNPPLFPAGVTPQDLVAVSFTDATTGLPRLSLGDLKGRGEAIVDDLVIADGGGIDDFAWSPDHTKLAVLAQPDGVVDSILYVVEPLTGTVTRVSGPQTAGTYVPDFAWSPDSSRLAFTRNQPVGEPLFVVRSDGSDLLDVTGPVASGGRVGIFEWAPDSSRLAILGDLDVQGAGELFVANRDGAGRVKVSGSIVAGGGIFDFDWSPDSTRIAVSGQLATTAATELFTVLADGTGARARVHPDLPVGGSVSRFEWAPDGSRLAYVSDQVTAAVFELFTSLPDGTGNLKLSGALVAGGAVEGPFVWAPDSSRIAFVADLLTDDVRELFTAPGDASAAPVKVSGPMIAAGDLGGDASFSSGRVAWSPDSSHIAYVADQELDGGESLYVTLATSASAVRVSPAPTAQDSIAQVTWTHDSTRVFFNLAIAGGGLHVSTVAGPAQLIVPSAPGFLSAKFPPLSFAGDRVVAQLDPTAGDVHDVRSYDLATLSETIVAEPEAKPFSSLQIE